MGAVGFDTLKYANTLKAAGMSAELAEAYTRALVEALSEAPNDRSSRFGCLLRDDLRDFERRITRRLYLAQALGALCTVIFVLLLA